MTSFLAASLSLPVLAIFCAIAIAILAVLLLGRSRRPPPASHDSPSKPSDGKAYSSVAAPEVARKPPASTPPVAAPTQSQAQTPPTPKPAPAPTVPAKPTVPKPAEALIQCPHCSSRVREDRLPQHIQQVHTTPKPRSPRTWTHSGGSISPGSSEDLPHKRQRGPVEYEMESGITRCSCGKVAIPGSDRCYDCDS